MQTHKPSLKYRVVSGTRRRARQLTAQPETQPFRRGGDSYFTLAKICWRLFLASPLLQAGVSPAFPQRHPTALGGLGAALFPRSSDKSLREFWQRSSEDELGSAPNSWKYLRGRICFNEGSLASSFPSPQHVRGFSDPARLLL